MKRLWISAVVVGLFTVWSQARAIEPKKDSPGNRNSDLIAPPDESPKEMLLRGSRIAERLDLDGFGALYDVSGCTELEKDLVKASLKYAIEASRIENALRDRFGQKAVDDFDHAIGEHSVEDVRQAEYKIDGGSATVTYPGEAEPAGRFVRKDGAWKLGMHASLKSLSEAELKETIKTWSAAAPKAAPLADKIKKGDFNNAEDAIDAFVKVVAPKDSDK